MNTVFQWIHIMQSLDSIVNINMLLTVTNHQTHYYWNIVLEQEKWHGNQQQRKKANRDWGVIRSTQQRCVKSEVCVRSRRRGGEAVVLNWDKLELLESLLLPGWPLKEQLVLAVIRWIDVASTLGYLGWSHRSIWAGTCSICIGRCVRFMWTCSVITLRVLIDRCTIQFILSYLF